MCENLGQKSGVGGGPGGGSLLPGPPQSPLQALSKPSPSPPQALSKPSSSIPQAFYPPLELILAFPGAIFASLAKIFERVLLVLRF